VLDSASSLPLAGVSLEFTLTAGQVGARATTDDNGQFRVDFHLTGAYRLEVQRIGYRAQVYPVLLDATSDTVMVLRLSAVPVELAPVVVTGPPAHPYLTSSGFYQRRLAGSGHFVDPPMVEKLLPKAKYSVDLLTHIPGVRYLIPSGSGGVRVPFLRSCRTRSVRLIPRAGDDATESVSTYPLVYLDGISVGQDAFGWLQPGHLLALEVYMGPAQVPLQYGGTNEPCGVILIWTKR
jgi:hypothetical protein